MANDKDRTVIEDDDLDIDDMSVDDLPVCDSDTVKMDSARASDGRFVKGHPGGPGRGNRRRKSDSEPSPDGKEVKREGGTTAQTVLDAVIRSVAADPQRFADTLVRKSPVSAGQLGNRRAKRAHLGGMIGA